MNDLLLKWLFRVQIFILVTLTFGCKMYYSKYQKAELTQEDFRNRHNGISYGVPNTIVDEPVNNPIFKKLVLTAVVSKSERHKIKKPRRKKVTRPEETAEPDHVKSETLIEPEKIIPDPPRIEEHKITVKKHNPPNEQ